MIYQYKYKFYLNASHYIVIGGNNGEEHGHCFEIVIDIALVEGVSFTKYSSVENQVNELLKPYQDKLINRIEPFNTLNPTLENMCEYFKEEIFKLLLPFGWLLLTIEISETPTRSYAINVPESVIRRGSFIVANSPKDTDGTYADAKREDVLLNINFEGFKKSSNSKWEFDYDVPDELMDFDDNLKL